MACYSISCHALAVSAEAWHPRRPGTLACYSISDHALAVSAEAWHAILYLGMPGSLSCFALAVSAEAFHAALYLVTPWQYPVLSAEVWQAVIYQAIIYLVTPLQYLPRLGKLCYILSCLGSICRGLAMLACCSISCRALAESAEGPTSKFESKTPSYESLSRKNNPGHENLSAVNPSYESST